MKIVLHLAPMLTICNGNGLGRSPWAVIQRYFGMEIVRERRVDPGARGSRQVKEGRLQQASSAGRDPGVWGRLPSLSPQQASLWKNEALRSLLREI